MKTPKLTERLYKIAEFVRENSRLADIGTDHAYLPVYLVNTGKINYAIASDIGEGPLERAKAVVEEYSAGEKVDIRLGSGLETVKKGEVDTAVIAGMGGMLIAEILETSKYLAQDIELILQPMTADDELREYLIKNNFRITKEVLAKEGEKIYNIIVARFGESEEYNDAEIYIGKLLREDIYFPEYLKRRTNKLKNAIEGIEKAENPDRDKLERLKNLLLETEEEFYES